MAGFNYKQRLSGLRQNHKIIGVYGMSASGITTFAKVAWERGLTLLGDMYSLPEIYITPELLGSLNITAEQAGQLSPSEIADAIANNYDAYKIAVDGFFEDRMNSTADQIRTLESVSGLNSVIFVECPLTTTVKYNDLFDAVIAITRPVEYEDQWWVEYALREDREFMTSDETTVKLLKNSDRLFNENKSTPLLVIHNDGDLEQFQQLCNDAIDEVL